MLLLSMCSEENPTIPDVGVDMLLKDGRLEMLKDGPIFWVDSADGHPCIGMLHLYLTVFPYIHVLVSK